MSYQVLARKWRPRDFSAVVGQGHVLKALVNALDSERLHHAYLFTGTRGVGKTTLARVFAKALNCEKGVSSTPCGTCSACVEIDEGRFVDLIEVDAASRTKVEETRDLLDNVPYAPTRARFKVYLIDEVHMFSNHSFNALLKTLEEPPPHVKFLLATTDPKKLPVTILSRCLQFNLTRLSASQLTGHLAHVLDAEGIPYDEAALTLIAQAAAGSVRDALSLLDQAIAHGGGRVDAGEAAMMLGTIDQGRILDLVELLAGGDGRALLGHARQLAAFAPDYSQVLAELLSLLRRVAVVHALEGELGEVESDSRVIDLASRMAADECQLFYQIALQGRRDLEIAPDSETGFEMVLLRMLAFRPAAPPAMNDGGGARVAQSTRAAEPAAAPTVAAPPLHESAPATPAEATIPTHGVDAPRTTSAPVGEGDADSDWTMLVDTLELAGLARELARNSALAARRDAVFELVIAPQFEKLAQRRHVETLESALGTRIGTPARVNVTIAERDDLRTPSEQRSEEAAARQQQAEATIADDPLVKNLQNTFDATIENVSAR